MSIFRKIKPPILLLLVSEVLLILLFPASLIFESTVTAGGDTPSHFISAITISSGLHAIFSPVTWIHGAYAGFPLFLQYFPLPFDLMAFISPALSLKIAFKLVTLLAIIPLPGAVYLCLRRLGYAQNTPAIGAVLSLLFLFMTENSMWGGNILSTLSGEFAFGISLILYIVFTGKLYADIASRKSPFGSSALEALIAMSNGYSLLQSAMGTSYFILRGGNLRYILRLHAAAFGLVAFWLLPVLWRIRWNTPFVHSWHFESWDQIAPPLLWPSFAGALMVACSGTRNLFRKGAGLSAIFQGSIDGPEFYLFWQFGAALLGFSLAPSLGLVDIRFLPFAHITLVLLGAVGWGRLLSRLPRPNLWLAAFSTGVVALALTRAASLDSCIQWNYSGMKSKPLWNSYRLVNEYLSGDENSPRVVYEHNEITNGAGTLRAFELLPYYSGRSTLEGLYMQSSPSSPFVFYIQSELTQFPSCPFSRYYYSRPDPDRAAAHLRLFNVSQVIAASDNIANALDSSPDYELSITFPPYKIYRVKQCDNSYVEPLKFRPLRIPPQDWKNVQFEWFRKSSLRVPLVVASEDSPGNFWRTLQIYDGKPERIPEVPITQTLEAPITQIGTPKTPDPEPPTNYPLDERIRAHATLGDGKITINTSKPGHPLRIKVSYHPDWRITEGAGELYPVSPAFMLLVPRTSRVVLTFDTGAGIYLWGKILSVLTILVLILKTLFARTINLRTFTGGGPGRILERRKGHSGTDPEQTESPLCRPMKIGINARFFAVSALLAAIILGAILTRDHRDPILLYDLAVSKLAPINDDKFSPAGPSSQDSTEISASRQTLTGLELLDECIVKFGHSSVLDYCVAYKALVMRAGKRWGDLLPMLEPFLKENPDNRIYAESLTWMGEACLNMGQREDAERFFRHALSSWPENGATREAGAHLAEMAGADALFEDAKKLIASGKYPEAYNIYRGIAFSPDKKTADESVLSLAYCSFHMNRFQEASDLFIQWLNNNFEAPESARVQADLRYCQTIIAQNKEWMTGPDPGSASPARSGLIVRFLNWAGRSLHREM
ncbi:MAG: 6-pyruvoyl-tetrahydropterin synthase-related protein [Syntrophobacteraceae bacterium]|jgi:TolA-binding protein